MKGKLTKTDKGWVIEYQNSKLSITETLPLHPSDVEKYTKGVIHFSDELVDFYVSHEYPESCNDDPFCMGDETCIQCLQQFAKLIP